MMAEKLVKKLPINCPYCDEEAYQDRRAKRVVTPHRIYTLRRCIMGHTFYSIEEVPVDQKEIVEEIRSYKNAIKLRHNSGDRAD
jgi:predicted nucleic acid-binding Zn finger protein